MSSKILLPVIVILLLPWLLTAFSISKAPLHADAFLTIGAGSHLYLEGHSSSTFMLYGLINPFALEILLNLGFGKYAPLYLRLLQFVFALLSMVLMSLSLKNLLPGQSNFRCLLVVFMVSLSSTIILRESFEPLPETGMAMCVSLLLYLITSYRIDLRHLLLAGLSIGLLVGFRPTALLLGLPVVLFLAEALPDRSYARNLRWVLLSLAISYSVVLSFTYPRTPFLLAIIFVGLISSILFFVLDLKKRSLRLWLLYAIVSLAVAAVIVGLFNNYIVHYRSIIQQIDLFHVQREVPVSSVGLLMKNIIYSLIYLFVVFPGPVGLTGLVSAAVFIIRKQSYPIFGLRSVLIGVLPFFILICRNVNFQSRYLIPLMPIVVLLSSLGLSRLLQRRYSALIAVPILLVSLFQTTTAGIHSLKGGMLEAFSDLSEMPEGTVSVCDMDMFSPYYYNINSSILYPLVPYIDPAFHSQDCSQSVYCVSYMRLPDGFMSVEKYGYDSTTENRTIREARNPVITEMLILIRYPHLWRHWSSAHLGVRY